MASETTELTFVRCPSCRSLVPASAARCRICNSPLENSAKSDEGDASKSGGRVRQKTMSADPNEVAAAIASAHADNAPSESSFEPVVEPTPKAPTPVTTTPLSSGPDGATPTAIEEDGLDPLSAYLEEMDEPSVEPVNASGAADSDPLGLSSGSEEKATSSEGSSFLEDLDDDDSWGVPPTEKQVVKSEGSSFDLGGSATDIPFGEAGQKGGGQQGSREDRRGQPNAAFPKNGDERRGPNAGAPRQERGGDAKGNDQRTVENKGPDSRPQRDRPQGAFGGPPQRREDRRDGPKRDDRRDERRDDRRDVRKDERKDDRRETDSREPTPRSEEPRQHQPKQTEKTAQRGPDSTKSENSKLFGWLVSFTSPEGKAIELRQGRFFVTASSIKASDLVIEHESISTPHALMLVHPGRGVMVQDLMSEHGLYVRRGESGEFKQEEGTIPLRHGDWLKFGKVEYLVALLPYAQK